MVEKEMTTKVDKLRKKLDNSMKNTKQATNRTEGVSKRLEKELWSVTAERHRFEEVLEKV